MVDQSAINQQSSQDQESLEVLLEEEKCFTSVSLGSYQVKAMRNSNGALYLSHCLDQLKQVQGKRFGYLYKVETNIYVWIGIGPIPPNYTIPLEASYPTLVLKLRPQKEDQTRATKSKPLVEMKISEVLNLIKEQTRLAQGISCLQDTKKVKLDSKLLEEAKIQVSKGKKYGFNFQAHAKDNMAILKRYITLCQQVESLNFKNIDVITKMAKLFGLIEKANKLCKQENCCEKIETQYSNYPLADVAAGLRGMSIEQW